MKGMWFNWSETGIEPETNFEFDTVFIDLENRKYGDSKFEEKKLCEWIKRLQKAGKKVVLSFKINNGNNSFRVPSGHYSIYKNAMGLCDAICLDYIRFMDFNIFSMKKRSKLIQMIIVEWWCETRKPIYLCNIVFGGILMGQDFTEYGKMVLPMIYPEDMKIPNWLARLIIKYYAKKGKTCFIQAYHRKMEEVLQDMKASNYNCILFRWEHWSKIVDEYVDRNYVSRLNV